MHRTKLGAVALLGLSCSAVPALPGAGEDSAEASPAKVSRVVAYPAVAPLAVSDAPAAPPTTFSPPSPGEPEAPVTPGEPATPAAPATPTAPVTHTGPVELVATAREAFVFVRPSRRSPRLGYLRLGARVRRDDGPAAGDGCPGGWYGVRPDGFVCVGPTASLDLSNAAAELAQPRPRRDDALPYAYARSKPVPPALYSRLPSAAEQGAVEGAATALARARGWEDFESSSVPESLSDGRTLPTVFGYTRDSARPPERALPNSAFALLSAYDHGGRRFGLTTELDLVPLDRVERVKASDFHGIVLDEHASLPVVFVRSRRALLYSGSPTRGLSIARPLRYREALLLSGASATIGARRYLETRAGEWLADIDLVRIDPLERPPPWASAGRSWIHVAIGTQTLVAYEGKNPVYATLVSTGRGGLGDPETTQATPLGEFLVHTKHVTARMRGDEVGDEFDLGDVPYVQYWSGGYAFHASYWHDGFGAPRSHGCVNLSPIDARWLFHFTSPPVPRGWHGAFSLREGTLVSITP